MDDGCLDTAGIDIATHRAGRLRADEELRAVADSRNPDRRINAKAHWPKSCLHNVLERGPRVDAGCNLRAHQPLRTCTQLVFIALTASSIPRGLAIETVVELAEHRRVIAAEFLDERTHGMVGREILAIRKFFCTGHTPAGSKVTLGSPYEYPSSTDGSRRSVRPFTICRKR